MEVGLFIPCYVDQFYPQVGISTLSLLEKLGCQVYYPVKQTCCGQPLANSGMEQDARPIYEHFIEVFADFQYIVAPSSSCVYHVKHHYNILDQTDAVREIRNKIYDITAFLTDILKVRQFDASFPHKVGLHQSCHGLRGLRMARASEQVIPPFSKWRTLLEGVRDLVLVDLDRPDECCGFGGTFSVAQADVSAKMGIDKIRDHTRHGADFITSGDMSCLMHLDGLLRRQKSRVAVKHIVEILHPI